MFNKKTLFSAILIIAILSISVGTVIAANDNDTVYVSTTGNDANPGTSDSPFKTIAKAVEATPENGVVFIKAGTYTDESDNRIVVNNNITIKGEDPTTTILIGKSFQIGTFLLGTSPTVTVQGLTFKGSGNNPLSADGLGVYINVKDSIFVDNNAIAIDAFQARLSVVNSSFINNNGGYYAGAIRVWGEGNVSNCSFINNTGGYAGAVYAYSAKGLVINKSSFSGNLATDPTNGWGNDLYTIYTTWLNDCVFAPVPVGSPQSDRPSLAKGNPVGGHIFVNGVEINV